MKTYFGISRDHSGSMRSIAPAAARDYNSLIDSIKTESQAVNQETIVSVVKCGTTRAAVVKREITNSPVTSLKPIERRDYDTDGQATPLFDSVGELIDMLENVPDANDPNVAFVVMAITDGGENSSVRWKNKLAAKIQELQRTDKWTFIFRVPRGYGSELSRNFGIPEGNILEWDQTDRGVEVAAKATASAMTQFYQARSAGQTSTKRFYADLRNVSVEQVKASLDDISAKVTLWNVSEAENDIAIRDFIEQRSGKNLLKGAAFYQLTKGEDKIGASKKICIRDKKTAAIYYGAAARDLMGIPRGIDIRMTPKQLGDFDVFVQSTSVNRKLKKNTQVLYWPDVGTAYKEGPSSK